MKGKQRLYIAYGSNLNLEQMAFRCPTAKVVGKSELKDYELLFRGGRRGAVATALPWLSRLQEYYKNGHEDTLEVFRSIL